MPIPASYRPSSLAASPEIRELSVNVPSRLFSKKKLGHVSFAMAMSGQPSLFRSARTMLIPFDSASPTPDLSLTSVNVPS